MRSQLIGREPHYSPLVLRLFEPNEQRPMRHRREDGAQGVLVSTSVKHLQASVAFTLCDDHHLHVVYLACNPGRVALANHTPSRRCCKPLLSYSDNCAALRLANQVSSEGCRVLSASSLMAKPCWPIGLCPSAGGVVLRCAALFILSKNGCFLVSHTFACI